MSKNINVQFIEQLLYESESNSLDFKEQQYKFIGANDFEKSELLKDILAFANSIRRTDAFILIGVRETKGNRAEIIGIDEIIDDAQLQQFVKSKTQKPIDFLYQTFTIENKQVGVIHIPLQDAPYYIKSDYGKVKANAVYIRRGSSTDIATPDEIIAMGRLAGSGSYSSKPDLLICFENNEQNITYNLPKWELITEEDIAKDLENYKSEYPKSNNTLEINPDFRNNPLVKEFAAEIYKGIKLAQNEEYDNYIEKKYRDFEEFLTKNSEYKNQQMRLVEINLRVVNNGTLPAENIDVFLHFPDGFELLQYWELTRKPKEPKLPMNLFDFQRNRFWPELEPLAHRSYIDLFDTPNRSEPNVKFPNIKRTNSYDVTFNSITKIKHNQHEDLHSLYALFESYEEVKSFKIDYKIHADNIPDELKGELLINFENID